MKLWWWLRGWRSGMPTVYGWYLVNREDGKFDYLLYIPGGQWTIGIPVLYWKKFQGPVKMKDV